MSSVGLGEQFAAVIEFLAEVTGRCPHHNVSWPQRKQQRCLDCGAHRVYDLQRGTVGEWLSPERPEPPAANQRPVTARDLVQLHRIRHASRPA